MPRFCWCKVWNKRYICLVFAILSWFSIIVKYKQNTDSWKMWPNIVLCKRNTLVLSQNRSGYPQGIHFKIPWVFHEFFPDFPKFSRISKHYLNMFVNAILWPIQMSKLHSSVMRYAHDDWICHWYRLGRTLGEKLSKHWIYHCTCMHYIIIVQENDDQQIKKNIGLKFPEFSLSFAKFSNSLSFPCREFLLSHFPCFPCSVGTMISWMLSTCLSWKCRSKHFTHE